MTKEVSFFKDVVSLLNQISILPYTDEELDSLGCLGFDMKKNKDFAAKYVEKLWNKRSLINNHEKIAFADLNVQLYREVLEVSDLQQIPDWIVMPQQRQENSIKARIVTLYENSSKEKSNIFSPISIQRDNNQTTK